MSKPPEHYKTEGIAKVLKLHFKYLKIFDCFTMQVIYYFRRKIISLELTPPMDFVHSREQISGTGSPSVLW